VIETLERLERIGAPSSGSYFNQANQQARGYYPYRGYGYRTPPLSGARRPAMNPSPSTPRSLPRRQACQ
jgi:hypothetical protein